MFGMMVMRVLILYMSSRLVAVVFVVNNSVHLKIRAGVNICFRLESDP